MESSRPDVLERVAVQAQSGMSLLIICTLDEEDIRTPSHPNNDTAPIHAVALVLEQGYLNEPTKGRLRAAYLTKIRPTDGENAGLAIDVAGGQDVTVVMHACTISPATPAT
ncbi:hypothetical protein LTR53_008826 [Teratosphaeriaceae sp. CCFEE 6253]|nr:hypothetical protein LTR53_008826 [Teratosphaeriaceae sp. CCFEE 6253]